MEKADELLASPPDIKPVEVLAASSRDRRCAAPASPTR
jgi:hypothetical protein